MCLVGTVIKSKNSVGLLVDPRLLATFPFRKTLGEPVSDFLVGGFDRVTSVADVTSDLDAEISTDGSHGAIGGHGSTEHLASLNAGILSLPNHSNDGSRSHVFDQSGEELFSLKIFVVGFHVFLAGLRQLHGNQLVSLLLEAFDNFTDKSTLDAIRLDLIFVGSEHYYEVFFLKFPIQIFLW